MRKITLADYITEQMPNLPMSVIMRECKLTKVTSIERNDHTTILEVDDLNHVVNIYAPELVSTVPDDEPEVELDEEIEEEAVEEDPLDDECDETPERDPGNPDEDIPAEDADLV